MSQVPTTHTPVDWAPLPGPQAAALACRADVVGYGGAAGGGKTDLLLGAAGTQHYRSIVFRRVFPSVRGIIERSREMFARGAAHSKDSYNEALHIWRLADGRTIEFASLPAEKDKEKYRGRPHDLYGFDELTEFSESQFRFVTAWNRTTRADVLPQVICTFNPPVDDDGQWVVRYFAPWLDPDYTGTRAAPGELRYYAMVLGKEQEVPADHPGAKSRTFIPAALKDNPHLIATGYADTIDALPEPLRSTMKGDFNAAKGVDPWRVIPAEWVRAAQARWAEQRPEGAHLTGMGVDVARGGKDQTSIARLYGQWYAPLSVYPGSDTPNGPTVAALILNLYSDSAPINIDIIGVGASVFDSLPAGLPKVGINAGAGSSATDRSKKLNFGNKRAEMWWHFREALDPVSGDGISLPPDEDLRVELCAPRFFVRTGKIWVESKDDIKERIGRSTDRADAVIMANVYNPSREIFDYYRQRAEARKATQQGG